MNTEKEDAAIIGVSEKKLQALLKMKERTFDLQTEGRELFKAFQNGAVRKAKEAGNSESILALMEIAPSGWKFRLKGDFMETKEKLPRNETLSEEEITQEMSDFLWKNSKNWRKGWNAGRKKALNSLMELKRRTPLSLEEFAQALETCQKAADIEAEERAIDKKAKEAYYLPAYEKGSEEALERLLEYLPPLYVRFQARDYLFHLRDKKRNEQRKKPC